ncbi:MAG: glycerol-3-phosphate dehydrogenase [Geminicoccus sp.]|nr:glycerol-3-phosphate dehydrogenase [Geminicoccus sp.]
MEIFDLAVIGGGVNGTGTARDAQGRGLKTLLVEAKDFASGTSSASTKLIHGGLRYLENYEFKMVGEALAEREVIMRAAPHIVWPLRFCLPHSPEQRPFLMIRAGLFLYDHLGKRELLPGSKGLSLRSGPEGAPLQDWVKRGFLYSDCWVQDARLVVLNAMDAQARGATVRTRTKVTSARRTEDGKLWTLTLQAEDGTETTAQARAVVNAGGPWAADIDTQVVGSNNPAKLRLVRGSHIVVPRAFDGDHAYIFQNTDGRILFAIPYEQDFTLIGTTDVEHTDDPREVHCTAEEQRYMLTAVNRYFKKTLTDADVVWTYAGVRPLLFEEGKSASKVSRDYSYRLDGTPGGDAPLLTIFGGKLTAYRELSEEAVDHFKPFFDMRPSWTRGSVLPGGDIGLDFNAALAEFTAAHATIDSKTAWRLLRNYGSFAYDIAQNQGEDLGSGVSQGEIEHLKNREYATALDDVLWRRSKLGLVASDETRQRINAILAA